MLGVLAAVAVAGLVAAYVIRAKARPGEPIRHVSDLIHDAQDTIKLMEDTLGRLKPKRAVA